MIYKQKKTHAESLRMGLKMSSLLCQFFDNVSSVAIALSGQELKRS